MNTRDSLQQLINLGKQEQFRKAVKELEIYLAAFTDEGKSAIDSEPVTVDEINQLTEIQTKFETSKVIWPEEGEYDPQPDPCHLQVRQFERKLKRRRRRLYDKHRHE